MDDRNCSIFFSLSSVDEPLAIDTENTVCSDIFIGEYSAKLFVKNDKRSSSLAIFTPNNAICIQGPLSEAEIIQIAESIHSI